MSSSKEWRQSPMGQESVRRSQRLWREHNPDMKRAQARRAYRRLRLDVLRHYGGSPPRCACCGYGRVRSLVLDHINGGGNEDRRQRTGDSDGRGERFLRALRAAGWPSGIRVLCRDCDQGMLPGEPRCEAHVQLTLTSSIDGAGSYAPSYFSCVPLAHRVVQNRAGQGDDPSGV